MKLAAFIEGLLRDGKVTIQAQPTSSTIVEQEAVEELLKEYYQEDILQMPGAAPAFSKKAAIWAAEYFYQAVQLTIIRDAGEEAIKEKLKSFDGAVTPSEIYSVDLIFRYLPSLFDLAKGLSPADTLVTMLEKTATEWPFSSVGIEINDFPNMKYFLSNSSLAYTYVDRIIQHKDLKRAADPIVAEYIREAIGEHTFLWPECKTLLSKLNDGNN